jgi:peptidoglycan hydrolase CwlO-like protein
VQKPWIGNIVSAVLGMGFTAGVLAVTTATNSQVNSANIVNLKEEVGRLATEISKLDDTVQKLSEAVARIGG